MSTSPLGRMSNSELLLALNKLVASSRNVVADLLAHLAEVDARDLYLAESCSSMFHYCTEVLHFSEATAFHRIHVARAARRFPILLEHVRQGRIHLAGLSLLVPHLTPSNHVELLSLAHHKSKRAIERLLADRAPRADVQALVQKLPETRTVSARPETQDSRRADEPTALARAPRAQASPLPAARSRNSAPEPLGNRRYKIQFTASQQLCDKLREAQGLLRHQLSDGDLAQVFDRALTLLIAEARRRKFAETSRSRSRAKEPARGATRHTPAEIKRTVAVRDHSVEGIELRCREHNSYAAIRDYGRDHMARFQRPA